MSKKVKDLSHLVEFAQKLSPGVKVFFRKNGATMPYSDILGVYRGKYDRIVLNREDMEQLPIRAQKHVVVHECVHRMMPGEGHSEHFWNTLDGICDTLGLPTSTWANVDVYRALGTDLDIEVGP